MLYAQVTTQDLLDLHPDLSRLFFAGDLWQYGTDGVLTGSTLPATFGSATAIFTDVNQRNGSAKNQIINIAERGFFRITEVTTGVICTIGMVSIAHQRVVNQLGVQLDGWSESDLTSVAVTPGTGLTWSIGGWESQIAHGYRELAGDLIAAQIPLSYVYDAEATYADALIYKSLCNVFNALTREVGDNSEKMALMYQQKYRGALEKMRNLCQEENAALIPDDFERNG